MAPSKTFHGARAQVWVGGKLVGLFHNVTYNRSLDAQDAFILGRVTAAEIAYTAEEPITGSLAGWRVVGNGPHSVGVPATQDLLTADYTSIVVVDRITGARIGSIQSVRLLGESGGQAARQLSEISIPFKGILMSDENINRAEPAGSSDLP